MRPFLFGALMSRKRKTVIVLLAVVLLLIAARVAHAVPRRGLRQRSADGARRLRWPRRRHRHPSLARAYSIDDIVIVKTGASRPVPFFRATALESLGGMAQPVARLDRVAKRRSWSRGQSGAGKTEPIRSSARERTGTRGSRKCSRSASTPSKSSNGTVRFLAPGIQTRDAITARHVNGEISNLTNVIESGKETFADFHVTAEVLEGAPAGSPAASTRSPANPPSM